MDDEFAVAWAGVAPPSPNAITSHDCAECDGVTAYFAGRSWPQLVDVDALRYNECALSLFTPQAFHYYLPAFMRATLLDPIGADVIPDGIRYNLERELGTEPSGWLPLFTPQQRQIFARFLRMLPPLGIAEEDDVERLSRALEATGT